MKITKTQLKEIIKEELTAQKAAFPNIQALLGPELYGKVMAEYREQINIARDETRHLGMGSAQRYIASDRRFADALEAILGGEG